MELVKLGLTLELTQGNTLGNTTEKMDLGVNLELKCINKRLTTSTRKKSHVILEQLRFVYNNFFLRV